MTEICTTYSTVGAQELLEKGYRVRRRSWGKSCYLKKVKDLYYSVDEEKHKEYNITDCMNLVWEVALEDNCGDTDWEIFKG